MDNKCCNIRDNTNFFDSDGTLSIDAYRRALWQEYSSNLSVGLEAGDNAGWKPVVLFGDDETWKKPTRPLARPKNSGTVTFDPLDCQNSQFVVDEYRIPDPSSAEIDCQYCEDFGDVVGVGSKPRSVLKTNKGLQVSTSSYGCCNGNCEVVTNQEDVNHAIPYILPQYVDEWADDKYEMQFPDVYYGETLEEDRNSPVYRNRRTAWEIFPRMGEIDYDPATSQYKNKRDHELAIRKANQANRTAGNFIVFYIGPDTYSDDEAETYRAKRWYKDNIEPCLGEFGYQSQSNKTYVDVDLPTPEEFTVPYGFNDGTQNNVFIGRKKRLSWWKWEISEAPIAWGKKSSPDVDGVTQFPSFVENSDEWDTQFYIPPGDCFIAKILPDEPESYAIDGVLNDEGQQQCPSGVKFMESGTMYVLPHDTYGIYISCNMYQSFYDTYQSIKDIATIKPIDRIRTALYAATHPLVDKVTIDLYKPYTLTNPQSQYSSEDGQNYNISKDRSSFGYANPYYEFMNWYDKTYMTSTNLNFISNDQDFFNTLVAKYGSWYNTSSSELDYTIGFDEQNIPAGTHIGLDLMYDFTVEYSKRVQGRTSQSENPNYRGMINAGMQSTFNYGGSKLEINTDFIERNKLISRSLEEDGVCQELSGPALFTHYKAFDDTIYRSEFLQSGYMDYATYYIRNGNDQGSPPGFCFECDEYSSYINYANDKCTENNGCFCDEATANALATGDFCYEKGQSIQDWTLRAERYYPVIYDYKSTPISVAFHADGGIFYRGSSDSGIVRFGNAPTRQEKSFGINLTLDSRSPFRFRIYEAELTALQSKNKDTYLCERFPIVGELSTPTIDTNNEWPIMTRPSQGRKWETQPSYIPGLSTKFAPRLTKYGGFDKTELQEMFPYGYSYLRGDAEKNVVSDTVYKYDSDSPFGCYSSDSFSLKNYVESHFYINIESARGLLDHVLSVSEVADFAGNRYLPENEWGETFPDEDYKRFTTHVEVSPYTDFSESVGQLVSADNPSIAWAGGGEWVLDSIPEKSIGSTYNLYVRLANPFLSKLLDTVGDTNNRVYWPVATNKEAWYDDAVGIPYSYCERHDQWYDFGDQTSTVRITIKAIPKTIVAKFALFPPAPIQLSNRVEFTPEGQLKTTSQDGVIATSFKNQLQSAGRFQQTIPKLTFNNIVDFPSGPQPYDLSESFLINEEESKSLAPLLRKVKDFSENRKFKIVLRTSGGNFFQLDGLPNRYESQGTSYEGFPHFVQVVRDGSNYNTYLPGAVPLVQKKTLEDITWVTKPNTRFTASLNGQLEQFESKWPLNLRLTSGYTIDPIKNTVTFPGTRMFFALFPKVDTVFLGSESEDTGLPIGSIIKFSNRTGHYFKYANPEDAPFNNKYVVFNIEDYTWQRYSDLHFDFLNQSYIGYVYNSLVDIEPKTFYFYRQPFGDREKIAESVCTSMRLKGYLVDSRGKRIFPGTLNDPCIDLCNDGGLTFLRTETELTFRNSLNVDWIEIDDQQTQILSSHVYMPDCVNNEKDYFLSNNFYRAKWSDLTGFDGIILDHSEEEAFTSKYYPPVKYNNSLYKVIVDNDNQSEISVNRGEKRHHSIVPFGNKGSAPFRYNTHQKYNVDYGNDLVNSAEISGVHNYLPFMDINDKDWGLGFTSVPKFAIPEVIQNFEDFDPLLVRPRIDELTTGDLTGKEYRRSRGDLQIVLTIPANATLTKTIEFGGSDKFVISDGLRADTPLFYLDEIDEDTNNSCASSQRDRLDPPPLQGSNYGLSFGGSVIDGARPYELASSRMPMQTWRPDSPFAIWTRYCDLDEPTCERQECDNRSRGQTVLNARYKLANPSKITYDEIAGGDMTAYISYNAGIVNGMNGVRPPKILRSIHSKQKSYNQKNDILYSKTNRDECNDRVVMPPEYQYPDWDKEIGDTFLRGVDELTQVARTYQPAEELLQADSLAEEMVFRALYGEKELVNRTSFNGTTLLTADQILNYVEPEINVAEMHNQILWSYDRSNPTNAISRVKTQHSFTVNARKRVGETASVSWGGVRVSASINANSTDVWSGNTMTITIAGGGDTQSFTVPVYVTNAVFSDLISQEAGSPPPEVEDYASISLVESDTLIKAEQKTKIRECRGAECAITEEYLSADDGQKIYDLSSVNMGSWKRFLVTSPAPSSYAAFYDTYGLCKSTNDIFGPDTEACLPYEYGYCNVTAEECPPCTGEFATPELVEIGGVNKPYYVTANIPVNNYIGTDAERFSYNYKYCRNLITNKGYYSKENYEYHKSRELRMDYAIENNSAAYFADLAAIPCVEGCCGECFCSKRCQGSSCTCEDYKGPCDLVTVMEHPSEDGCGLGMVCSWSEPFTSIGSECFCRGPVVYEGGELGTCFVYGVAACFLLWSYPMVPGGADCCQEAKDAALWDSSYWYILGYDPEPPDPGWNCATRCYPRGYCSTPYHCFIRDPGKCPQSKQEPPECTYGWEDDCGACGYTWGRAQSNGYNVFRCGGTNGGLLSTPSIPAGTNCRGDGPQWNCPSYDQEDVIETAWTREYSEPEQRYDTYLRDTNYGGGDRPICNSGDGGDCVNALFSVSLDNDTFSVTFPSGELAWASHNSSPGASPRCVGPELTTTSTTLCRSTASRTNENNGNLTVNISDNLGHITNYNKTDSVGCGNNVKVNLPPQSPDWAIQDIEGEAYVGQWVGMHVNENILTGFGLGAVCVCQSEQMPGAPCIGELAVANLDSTFNSAGGGGNCYSEQVENTLYAVCEGNLYKPDCADSVSCPIGEQAWFEELTALHESYRKRFNMANTSIPTENIVEGMIPGSVGELQTKTYQIPSANVIRRLPADYGAITEEAYAFVTVAFYTYRYRSFLEINDSITNARNSANAPEGLTGASCFRGRPLGSTEVADDTLSLEKNFDHCKSANPQDCLAGDIYYRPWEQKGAWRFEFATLNFRNERLGVAFPNWYFLPVAPHGCFPQYGGFYMRYDTPPRTFLTTTATIESQACNNFDTCYYNDKQWPAAETDFYGLSAQGTFLHCHKFLGKNWTYDYYRESPI